MPKIHYYFNHEKKLIAGKVKENLYAFLIAALFLTGLVLGLAHKTGNESNGSVSQTNGAGRSENINGLDTGIRCVQVGVNSYKCGEHTIENVIWKHEGKTVQASVTMYSRLDSCHNKIGSVCLTAIGRDTKEGVTVACPRNIKLGTKVEINGKVYVCEDRTAVWVQSKFGQTFDIFTENYQEAIHFGRKTIEVALIK